MRRPFSGFHSPSSARRGSPAALATRFAVTIVLTAAIAIVPALAGGCGGQASTVTGVVTLDNQPLTTGVITFHGVASGAAAYGNIDSSGRFELRTGDARGLPPGDYVATVVATEEPPPVAPGQPELPGKLLTPPVYGDRAKSPLKFTVKPGGQHFPIHLTRDGA